MEAVEEYLRLRRALGYKLVRQGQLLHDFACYLDINGADHVTVDLSVAWSTLPRKVQPIWWHQRLGVVRGFAAYQVAIDPRTEVPPKDLLVRNSHRRAPYLYSNSEITSLMRAAGILCYPLKAVTYETLIGLLACTGMRVGEAIRLNRADVDLDCGVITVLHSKFGKSRRLPLHKTTAQALATYDRRRDELCRHPKDDSFFVSLRGTRLNHSVVDAVFKVLIQNAGMTEPLRAIRALMISDTLSPLRPWSPGIDQAPTSAFVFLFFPPTWATPVPRRDRRPSLVDTCSWCVRCRG